MFILQRYLLRTFVKVLFVVFAALSGLYIIIDAFGHLDEFMGYSDSQGGLLRVLGAFYGPRLLSFFDRTSSFLVQIAAIFVITLLQRSNELTAILAAGVSKIRVVRPLIGAAAFVSLFAVANRELLIPRFRTQLLRTSSDLLGSTAKRLEARFDNKTSIRLDGRATIAREQRIERPSFRLPPTLNAFGRQLAAENAVYRPATMDQPSGYLLQGMESPAPEQLAKTPSGKLGNDSVVLSPSDTPWLQPDECFVVSDIGFEQLAGGHHWRQFASLAELIVGLHNPSYEYGADVRVTIHARIVRPLMDLTLLFLGLPLVLSRSNRNVFLAAAISLSVVASFWVTTLICHTLGGHGLISPALAAWGPLMLFVPLAVGMSRPLKE